LLLFCLLLWLQLWVKISADSGFGYSSVWFAVFSDVTDHFYFFFLMKKLGRHLVFQFGCVCLFLAGVLGYLALQQQQFYLLCLSHFSLGLFISTANFYRFAASDRLATDLIPKATAMVISGGVIAAVIAPMLAIQFQQVAGLPDFTAIYFIFSVLALLLSPILYLWNKNFNANRYSK
jgi:hypothetical protein